MRGRLLVQGLKEELGLSERRACRLVGIGRSTYRYKSVTSEENEQLQERIVELALIWRRFGYRRLHALLDEDTRECLACEVDTSLTGARVVRILDRLVADRGYPKEILSDKDQSLLV